MTFSDSAAKAFESDQSKEYAEKYLSELLTTWREAEKSTSRAAFLVVVSCISVELIRQGIIREVSVSGVKIADATLLQIFLPVLVAYLHSNLLSLGAECSLMETAFNATFRQVQPELYRGNFERALYPANSTFFSGDRFLYAGSGRASKLFNLAVTAKVSALILAPIAYIVFNFVTLFSRMGPAHVGIWVSIAACIGLFVASIVSIAAAGTIE